MAYPTHPLDYVIFEWSLSEDTIRRYNGGSQKGDVYSFALVLYEIMGRKGPWGNQNLSPKDITSKSRSSFQKPTKFGWIQHFLFILEEMIISLLVPLLKKNTKVLNLFSFSSLSHSQQTSQSILAW